MVYTQSIANPTSTSPFNTGFSALFSECDLMRLSITSEDFLPFELARPEKGLYMHMIRSIRTPIPQFDLFEMGGRLGEETVYGYLAVRKSGSQSGSAYLLVSKPSDFGVRLLAQFKIALRKLSFFDMAIVQ